MLTSPQYLLRHGCSLLGAQRTSEAITCFRQAIAVEASFADAHYWLGATLVSTGDVDEGEASLRRAVELNPRHADAYARLALLAAHREDHVAAIAGYRTALAIVPKHADAMCNLGISLGAMREWVAALECLRVAVELNPSARLYSNLGNAHAACGDLVEAEKCYRRAIALNPGHSAAHDNLGVLFALQGRRSEAEDYYRKSLALDPDNAQAALNLGQHLLAEGRLEEGWRYYESRYSPRLPGPSVFVPQLPCPQWRGEPLVGRALLIWQEQGLGDEIQFSRYLPMVKALGVRKLTFVCRTELHALFRSLAGVDVLCHVADPEADIAGHDFWSFTMSLPCHCKTSLAGVPSAVPYLSAPPERVAKWRVLLPAQGLRVGIVWRGNTNHHNDNERSLPTLEVLAPLWSVPGVSFVSLQRGAGEAQAGDPPAGQALTHLGGKVGDLADTAAIVEQLDLVITVDTAVAHLAGALGRPCWVMLPWHQPDWRWLLGRDDSPWYPSMRLFRQTMRGDWQNIVAAVRADLSLLAAAHAAST